MKTFCINQLRFSEQLQKEIPSEPGVYKWWCKKDLLNTILESLELSDDCITDIEISNKNGSEPYYCIYVGDTGNLHRRIINDHLKGNIKGSTFRNTIAAIILGYCDETQISEIEDTMILDVFWGEEMEGGFHDFQNKLINEKFRVLNNKDINADNELYSISRHYQIAKNGKSRKSTLITEKRRLIK